MGIEFSSDSFDKWSNEIKKILVDKEITGGFFLNKMSDVENKGNYFKFFSYFLT